MHFFTKANIVFVTLLFTVAAYAMSGSKYNPINLSDIDGSKIDRNFIAGAATIPAGTTANLDILVTDDMLHEGTQLIIKDSTFGDYVEGKVVDVTGIYAPAGTVLKTPMVKWYVTDGIIDGKSPYPKKILAGLYLRMVYHSVALLGDPKIAVNLYMHKILE